MLIEGQQITLDIAGLGIIFYSPTNVCHLREGENYLSEHYDTAERVLPHIFQGTLVGFGTCSSGTFILRFHSGYPDEFTLVQSDFTLRLGLYCEGGIVCFRDLYDLLNWTSDCPASQKIALPDGNYHVTLCSDLPQSGQLGDNQLIDVYLQRLEAFPQLKYDGIPTLCQSSNG